MENAEFLTLATAAAKAGLEALPRDVRERILYPDWSGDPIPVECFYAAYKTGHTRGGNSWSRDKGTTHQEDTSEEAGRFPALNDFLLDHFLNLPFLVYQKLSESFEVDDLDISDGYGFTEHYKVRKVRIEDVWSVLHRYKQVPV